MQATKQADWRTAFGQGAAGAGTSPRDPILVEIIKNALEAIADEMGVSVVQSGYSSFVKEGADASAAILSVRGELVAQSATTHLLHASSLRESIQSVMTDYPLATMADGDVFLMNDPARGGVHSNDIAVFKPVFVAGHPAFFTATLIHVADLGGVSGGGLPAQATEIYHEGLLLPPVPLFRAGVLNDVVSKIIQLNSRTPEKVMGDIRALVAGCNVGALRLHDLVVRHGLVSLQTTITELLDYTERRMRSGIEKLPEGPITRESLIDGDGIDASIDYRVQVTLRRDGSDLTVDFTGTSQAARGAINASNSQAMSGVVYGVRCFVDPAIPLNEGVFRPLHVVFPKNTLVNPGPRAAVNARIVTVMATVEAIREALSTPEFGIATSGILHMQVITGHFPDSGKTWIVMDLDFGGIGARAGADGPDATGVWSGRTAISQMEPLELEFPLLFEKHALIPDSGGAGTWRGGLGVERTLRMLVDIEVSVRGDRMRFPPSGVHGGGAGRSGCWIVNIGKADERRLASKQMGVRLKAGDTLTLQTSGGGGYGRPEARDPEQVRQDVLARLVSPNAARDVYAVALTGPDFIIDHVTTKRLRSQRKAADRTTGVHA